LFLKKCVEVCKIKSLETKQIKLQNIKIKKIKIKKGDRKFRSRNRI